MRTPFAPHLISKLPKATKAQNDAVKADFKKGVRCTICGGWHLPEVVHLDYVGHAALTDRLLDVDPDWDWEPFAVGEDGLPMFDRNGGLWIRLTILDKTRPGYGDADGKTGGNAVKEAIGDALRNAAMRFGAALDLWHKGDLHPDADEGETGGQGEGKVSPPPPEVFPEGPARNITGMKDLARALWREIEGCGDTSELNALLDVPANKQLLKQMSLLENANHREIWEGDGKDNPGIAGLINRKETEFAQHIADIARV
jgi:hypothetical protein